MVSVGLIRVKLAQNNLESCSTKVTVCRRIITKLRLYKLAADQGHALAQDNLGMCYYNGYGVPQDYHEAVRLHSWRPIRVKLMHTQSRCGYDSGQGVPQASRRLRAAAGGRSRSCFGTVHRRVL